MKRNKVLRIASVLLVLALVTTCGMTGAMAKYVDTFNTASSKVRAGLFRVTGPGETDASLGLLIDTDGSGNETNATKYAADTARAIIVPGSVLETGAFTITNYSEVDVDITLTDFAAPVTSMPLLFCRTNSATASDWKAIGDITAADILDGSNSTVRLDAKSKGGTTSIEIPKLYFKWVYEAETPNTNAKDTDLGESVADYLLATAEVPCENLTGCDGAGAHDGACGYKAAVTEDLTRANAPTEFTINFKITATQVD